jgi:hypothetical protein
MSNQILISSGAKLRDLDDVIIGTDGVLTSLGFNVANGVPKLDENGKILVSQLPNSVMEFKGVWNAATNTPTLADGTGNAGDVYLCNVAGTVNFGSGPIAFAVGDYAVYTGTVWARSSGATGTVTSVGLSRSGDALTVTGSPITTSGTINIGFAGTNLQYINGAGNLVTFPTIATEAQRLITEVYNETGATLAKGSIVYINGGHGNLPTVTKAIATGDATSAQTYGIVQNDIGNNNNGFVVVIGSLTDLDTQAYTEGTQLYLSGTTAGAWTSTKPYAPVHLVYVAIVTRSHPTQGVVEVSIQNGYEMDELHNVAAQNPDNNDILQYKTSTSLWTKVAGTTSNIAEGSNLYFTNARARQSISLTTTGSTGASTYDNVTGVLNIPNYVDQYVGTVTSVGLSAPTGFSVTGSPVTSSGTLALSFASGYSLPTNVKQSNWDDAYTWVAAFPTQTGNNGKFLTTDGSSLSWATVIAGVQSVTASSPLFSSGGANPNITIQVATTSQNGYLSSTDWNTFNGKQNTLTLTTTGTSGAATLIGSTLNIPNYQAALTNPVTGTGASGYVAFWDSASSITGESNLFWDATNNRLGISISTPRVSLDVEGAILTRYTASTLSNKLSGLFAQSGSNIETAFGFLIQDGFAFQGSWDGNNDMLSVRAATIDGSLGSLVASINTAGVGFFASNLTATNYIANLGNDSRVFTTTGATTGYQYADMNNTSGRIVWGIEGSTAGTIAVGSLAYAAVVQSAVPTSVLQLGVDGTIRATFTSTAIGFGTNTPFGNSFTIQQEGGVRNRNSTNIRYRSDWVVRSTGGTLFNSYDDTGLAYKDIEINAAPLYLNAISGSGNVLIGTYTDNGAKLQVSGAGTFSSTATAKGVVVIGASGGYTTGDNTYINLGASASPDVFGAINAPYGDKLRFNAYHGFDFRTSNGGASGTPVSIGNISTTGDLSFSGQAVFGSTVQATRFAIGGTPYVNVGYTFKGTLNGNSDTWGTYQGVLNHAPSANNALAVGYHAAGAIIKGGYTGLSYRGLQVDGISASGSGTIASTYGLYIDSQTVGTVNYSAYFAQTVLIATGTPLTGGGTLQVNGNVNINGLFQINGVTIGGGGGSGVTGSGTANYLTKWTGSSTLSNSVLYESGNNVAIGNTVMIAKLNVYGVGGGSGSNSNLMLTTGNNSDYFGNNQIVLAYNNTEGLYAHAIKSRHNSAGYAGNAIDFYTWKYGDATSTIAGKYIMTLLGNGCVGIGETNPALSVGGEYGGLVVKNSMYLQLRLSSSGSESAGMEFKPATGNAYEIQANSSSQWFVYDRTNSQYRLNIFSNGNVVLGGNSDNGYKLQISGSASFAYGYLSIFRGSSGANDIFVGNDGNRIYIGGNTYVVGNVTATGGFFDTSDSRLKTLVEDNYLLSSIANVKAKLYKKNGVNELGYYAQDLESILPSAVKEGSDGFLSLSYAQVHTAKIAVIEDEVTILKNRVSELESKLQKYDA